MPNPNPSEIVSAEELVNYRKLEIEVLHTLEDKILALVDGDMLLIKSFEQGRGRDVLVRLMDNEKCQISYGVTYIEQQGRFWTTYNVGINDLADFTIYKFVDSELPENMNQDADHHLYANSPFDINEVVSYHSIEASILDKAIVEEIWVDDFNNNPDSAQFAFKLSREGDTLYKAEGLKSLN